MERFDWNRSTADRQNRICCELLQPKTVFTDFGGAKKRVPHALRTRHVVWGVARSQESRSSPGRELQCVSAATLATVNQSTISRDSPMWRLLCRWVGFHAFIFAISFHSEAHCALLADGATGEGGVPPSRRVKSTQYLILGAGIAAACCVGVLVAWTASRQASTSELLGVGDAYASVYRQVGDASRFKHSHSSTLRLDLASAQTLRMAAPIVLNN